MKKINHLSSSSKKTQEIARKFAKSLKEEDVVALTGELGSGKTTFVQGLADGLGVTDFVNSPTFKLVNEFSGRLTLYHFDFYRLDSSMDLVKIGFEEYINSKGITVIEWADKFPELIPDKHFAISFQFDRSDENNRRIEIATSG